MLAVAGLALLGPAVSEASVPSAATLARMDRTIEQRMDANRAPGFAVAVVAEGRIVHARGFGSSDDSEPRITPQTPFLLGSTTKSFTALAVMQLVDAGKVQLDAPVRRYVPEFRLSGTAANRVTVRHVLQHTSGLPATTSGPILKSAGDGTPEQAVAELRGEALVSEPGREMEYVNANYVLAGLVVERASGESYGRYVERHIFAPLGMANSFAAPEPARRAGLAAGHRYIFGVADTTGPTFRSGVLAAGYLMSSAEDMGRYLSMFLNDGVGPAGRRVVSSRGMEALMSPGRPAAQLGPWADNAKSHYAMGWFVGGPWKEPALLHPGDAADSSSLMVLLPRQDTAVVTLVNASNELVVPGNPYAIPRMQRNVVDVVLGAPVETGTSVFRFYIIFDVLVALFLGAAVVALIRAVRDARRRRTPRHRVRAVAGVPARAALAALVLGYPALIGYGWTGMRYWHPDLALALALVGGVVLATAVTRVVWLVRSRGAESQAPPARPSEADFRPSPQRELTGVAR